MKNLTNLTWNELRTMAKENNIKVTNKISVMAALELLNVADVSTTMELPLGFTGVEVSTTETAPLVLAPIIPFVVPLVFSDAEPLYVHCLRTNDVYKVLGEVKKGTREIVQLAKREDVIAKINKVFEIDKLTLGEGKRYNVVTPNRVRQIVAAKKLAIDNAPKASVYVPKSPTPSKFIVNMDNKRNLSVYHIESKKSYKAMPGTSVQSFFKKYDTMIAGVKATITITDAESTTKLAPSVCVCEICKKRAVTTASQSILKRYSTLLPTEYQDKAICFSCQSANGLVAIIKGSKVV